RAECKTGWSLPTTNRKRLCHPSFMLFVLWCRCNVASNGHSRKLLFRKFDSGIDIQKFVFGRSSVESSSLSRIRTSNFQISLLLLALLIDKLFFLICLRYYYISAPPHLWDLCCMVRSVLVNTYVFSYIHPDQIMIRILVCFSNITSIMLR
ncbi:hypothetical protein L9F63_013406, partial [Diploptera punctata]